MIPDFFRTIFGEKLTPKELSSRIKDFNAKLNSNPEISEKFNELIKLEQELLLIVEKYKSASDELTKQLGKLPH